MREKWYVGVKGITYEAFKTSTPPVIKTHGHLYNLVIGPFKTKRGAVFMASYGRNNPHCQTVNDAEKLAKRMENNT